MKAALVGPVGDTVHIWESVFPFMQNGGNLLIFYILIKDPWHPLKMGTIGSFTIAFITAHCAHWAQSKYRGYIFHSLNSPEV